MIRLAHCPRTGDALRRLVVGLGLALITATCSQCRSVERAVTGVDLRVNAGASGYGECVRACAAGFRKAHHAEQRRYVRAVRECGGVPACIATQRARHQAQTSQLVRALRDCRVTCYNEGSGDAGG